MRDSSFISRARPYLADLGRVGFLSLLVIALAVGVMELLAPGVAVSYVSPQRLIAAAALCGALSLIGPASRSDLPRGPASTRGIGRSSARSARRRAVYIIACLVLSAVAAWAVWGYLASMPFARTWVTLTAALAVVVAFAAFGAEE